MNSRALPSSATSRSMRASIRACTVTSSAVVGSSQMSTAGSHASAMASITRWRCPPESWCGYERRVDAGSGSSTRASSSSARSSASRATQIAVQAEGLGHLAPDAHERVEGRHRLLEHHRQPVAPQRAELPVGQRA